jgi:hypothetical protein
MVLDSEGVKTQFFVGPDKNGAQVKREVLAKHLRVLVQSHVQGKEVWCKKATGTLFVDKRRLVTIHVQDESSARLDWAHSKRIDLKIDQGVVEEAFKALLLDGGPSSS